MTSLNLCLDGTQANLNRMSVVYMLSRITKRTPSHLFSSVIHSLSSRDDLMAIETNWMLSHQLYDYAGADDGSWSYHQEVVRSIDALSWLTSLVWAGIVHQNPSTSGHFRSLAEEFSRRVPEAAANHQVLGALSDWLAELRPDFTLEFRVVFTDWMEEILTSPGQNLSIPQLTPDTVMHLLNSGMRLPNHPWCYEQVRRFFSTDWLGDQSCIVDSVSYYAVSQHLLRQIIAPGPTTN